MLHEISYQEYQRVETIARPDNIDLCKEALRTYQAIFTFWNKELGADKISILGFVINRTLRYGKYAEKIPFSAFMEGVQTEEHGMLCAPVGVSHNTFRRILRELINDHFLFELFPKRTPGKKDVAVRYFEINFKKIQHRQYNEQGEIMVLLRTPKAQKIGKVLPNLVVPKMGVQSISNVHTYVCNSIPKGMLLADSAAIEAGSETMDSVKEVIARMNAARDAKQAKQLAIAKTKPASGLKKIDVQTMLDKSRKEFSSSTPRIYVTDKAFGVFKKRLADSAPASLPEFFDWLIVHWQIIAQQNLKARSRKLRTGDVDQSAPIGLSPDFDTLAYRFPYFLKCYNSYVAERSVLGTKEDQQEAEIARLKRANENLRVEKNDLAKKAYARPRQPIAEPLRRVTRSISKPLTEATDELPTWEEFSRGIKRRQA